MTTMAMYTNDLNFFKVKAGDVYKDIKILH
jgi:hypothetical protein